MTHWAFKYIGIPYKLGESSFGGTDCYGLLRLIYKTEKGTELPLLPGILNTSLVTATKLFIQENPIKWVEIPVPQDGCGVAMGENKAIHHLGVWTDANGGRILHAWKKNGVIADTLEAVRVLRLMKIVRFYQYGIHH